MIWLKACPKCRGDLVLDSDYYGNYVSCIQCGHSLEQSQQSQLQQRLFTTKQAADLQEMMSSSRVVEEKVA